MYYGKFHRQGIHHHELGGESLCGGHRDLRSGQGIQHIVGLPGNAGAYDVHNSQSPGAFCLRDPESLRAVGSLAGLGDNNDKGIRRKQDFAVPELRSQFHPYRNLRQIFQDILTCHPHMPGGTTGHNVDRADTSDGIIVQSGFGKIDPVYFQKTLKGIFRCPWLFVDLLHHEMLIAALFCRPGFPGDLGNRYLNLISVQIEEMYLSRKDPCRLMISDIIHLPGVIQESRHIGGKIGLAFRDAQDHGTVLPGSIDFTGIVLEHQRQSVASPYPDHHTVDGVDGPDLIFFVVIVDQLDHDLRVGLTVEGIVMSQQLFLQLFVILDDPVVNPDYVGVGPGGGYSWNLAADVGVSVSFTGLPVGSPAGMADAAAAWQRFSMPGLLLQMTQLSGGLYDLHSIILAEHGKPCRIIAPVFQAGKTRKQNLRGLTLSGISNYSTHKKPPVLPVLPLLQGPPFDDRSPPDVRPCEHGARLAALSHKKGTSSPKTRSAIASHYNLYQESMNTESCSFNFMSLYTRIPAMSRKS